jgi:hypothetical protein
LLAVLAVTVVMLGSSGANGAILRIRRARPASGRHANLTLRQRLHVNPLITDIGTLEVEWDNLYSGYESDYSMPSTVKYTPEGSTLFWGKTEYSVSFDSLEAFNDGNGGRPIHFSDRITATATSVVLDLEHFDLAAAPQITSFLRNESGIRAGATVIGRFDFGRNSLGLTAGWSGGTTASLTNPSGILDLGYGRRLADNGWLKHVTPHTNFIYEKSTGITRIRAMFEGVEYQINDSVALDVSGQHFSVPGGNRADHQIFVGLTVNLGRLPR